MRKSKSQDYAYHMIKHNIESGKWPDGFHLIEQDIADQLKMSRTPIREVILRLEIEGFVKRVANKGVVVCQHTISAKEFIERTQLLELLCSQYIYQLQIKEYTISQDMLESQLSYITAQEEESKEQYLSLWDTLIGPLENSVMKQIITEIVRKMTFVEFPHASLDFLYEETIKLFNDILIAFSQKNYEKARKLIRVYVNRLNLELIDQQI